MSVVVYSIGVSEPITPAEPLPALPAIERGALVIVEGRAPIWRYGAALHLLHGSPASAVAFFDPRLGAVIVATHSPQYREGEIIDFELPANEKIGPKSVSDPSGAPGSMTTSQSVKAKPLDERILDWLRPMTFYPQRLTLRFASGTEFDISRLRGVWGRALKTVDEAAYAKIFEGRGECDHQTTPRYLIRPAMFFGSNQTETNQGDFQEEIDFITWGTTKTERQILIRSWNAAANFGLGRKRLPFTIESTKPSQEGGGEKSVSVETIVRSRRLDADAFCRLQFPVPLRLIAARGNAKWRIETPTFSDLVRAALTRLGILRRQILDAPANTSPDNNECFCDFFDEAMRLAEKTSALPWIGEQLALRRYSGRQKTEINLAGTVGSLELPEGPGLLGPILAAAEIFHLGKSTTLGLGRMILNP